MGHPLLIYQNFFVVKSYLPKPALVLDRKSTRLNSSHVRISYAVFCLKKKIAVLPSFSLSPPRFLAPLLLCVCTIGGLCTAAPHLWCFHTFPRRYFGGNVPHLCARPPQ